MQGEPANGPATAVRRPAALGRRRDSARDPVILAAALQLLTQVGYARMTLEEVAARTGSAKTTIYRRWPTKEDLVLAAIATTGPPPEAAVLPDTGDLRSDLVAVVDSTWLGGPEPRLRLLGSIAAVGGSSERIAAALRSTVTDPYIEVYRALLSRWGDRGAFVRDPAVIDLLAQVVPAVGSHLIASTDGPVDRDAFVAIIDGVLLPALGLDRG